MSEKMKKIKKLKKEIEVKNALIAKLVNIIAENKVKVDDSTLHILTALYKEKE